MQMSAAEAGLQPQENGVVATTAAATGADGGGGGGGDTSVKYFGPANRSEYDQAQWGMVHVARSTEPPPTARRRQQGVPAFLRNARALGTEHQPTYHRLGSLLTILHEIPAARNFLVRFGPPDQPLPDSYGHGADWWKGEPIIPPDVLAAVQRNEIQWGDDTEQPLHHELHRLMAFLDGTDRSYGSADSIIEMRRVVAVPTWGGDLESLVLAHMKELAAEEAMLFLTPLTAEIGLNTNDRGPDQQLFMVDFEVHRNTDVWAFIKTLYNAFDIFCWSDILVNGPEPTHVSMKVFTHTPPVLTMRFTFDGVDDRIDVPETLYLDRYMEERRAEAIEIQLVIVDIYRAVSRARELEERLVRWTDSSGHSWDKREQLAKTIRLNQERIRAVEQTARWRAFDPSDILETPYDDDSVAPLTVPEERLKEAWENEIRLCEERLAEITVKLQSTRTPYEMAHLHG